MPVWLTSYPGMSLLEKVAYAWVARFADADEFEASNWEPPTIDTMSDDLNLSREECRQVLRDLQQRKFIQIRDHGEQLLCDILPFPAQA
jgi:hypothetical protein